MMKYRLTKHGITFFKNNQHARPTTHDDYIRGMRSDILGELAFGPRDEKALIRLFLNTPGSLSFKQWFKEGDVSQQIKELLALEYITTNDNVALDRITAQRTKEDAEIRAKFRNDDVKKLNSALDHLERSTIESIEHLLSQNEAVFATPNDKPASEAITPSPVVPAPASGMILDLRKIWPWQERQAGKSKVVKNLVAGGINRRRAYEMLKTCEDPSDDKTILRASLVTALHQKRLIR